MSGTVTMKLSEAINLYNVLTSLQNQNNKFPVKFSYAILKNTNILKFEVDTLNDLQKPSIEFEGYNSKREEICKKYSEKNEDGSVKTRSKENGAQEYVIDLTRFKEFESKLVSLNETSKDVIEEQNKKMLEVVSMLEEDRELTFYTVPIESFPDTIEPELLKVLWPIIKED